MSRSDWLSCFRPQQILTLSQRVMRLLEELFQGPWRQTVEAPAGRDPCVLEGERIDYAKARLKGEDLGLQGWYS